jgi:hypothetical protein
MAVRERSLGPLYIAWVPVNRRVVPIHTVGVVEECEPFRRGRGVLMPIALRRGLVVGLWTRYNRTRNYRHLGHDRWIMADEMDVAPMELGEWDRGPGEEKAT